MNFFVRHRLTLTYIAIGLVATAFGVWYRSAPIYQQFASGVPDDAAYYLKPALNFALGHGSSFDGVNPTNGYQPLWFLTLVAFFKTLPVRSMTLESIWYATLFLQAALIGAFTAMMCRVLARITGSFGIGALLGCLPLLLIPNRLINLLETPLQLLVFSLLMLQLLNLLERPAYEDFRERLLLLGVTTGALFLARTDGIFMAAALLVPLCFKFRRDIRRLIWFVAPIAIVGLCYAGVNYEYFGVLMPSSGLVKLDATRALAEIFSGWTLVWQKLAFIFGPGNFASTGYKVLIQIGAFAIPLVFIIRVARGRILANRELVVFGAAAFLLLKYLGYTTIYHGYRTSAYWYWVIDAVIWLFACALIVHWLIARPRARVLRPYLDRAGLVLLLAILCGRIVWEAHVANTLPAKPVRDTSVLLDLAYFIRDNSYFDAMRLGAFNAGILGYFSNKQFTNLDGLINSPAYARLIIAGEGNREKYIKDNIDILAEYHASYVPYYTNLGFLLYNVRDYISNPVPYDPESGNDYRIYVRPEIKDQFEAFLHHLKK